MKPRHVLLLCVAILALLFLACDGAETSTEQPETTAPPEATAPPEPTATATAEHLWTSKGDHGLWPKDCLEDDTSPLCVTIAELTDGTLIRPGPEGCVLATWAEGWEDPDSWTYCHVQVASGDFEGEWGWVSEPLIQK
jgi:hypothetical protein